MITGRRYEIAIGNLTKPKEGATMPGLIEELAEGNGMAKHKIVCEDCGDERETSYKNTKYCVVCRLLRNLNFIGTRRQKCPVCKETFAPMHRNELMCGKCNPKKAVGSPRDICAFCKEEKDLILDRIKVCHECATNPDNREQFLIAMAEKVRYAKHENGRL